MEEKEFFHSSLFHNKDIFIVGFSSVVGFLGVLEDILAFISPYTYIINLLNH